MKSYIYVDFENLNNLKELKQVSGKYIFFIGTKQTKLNSDLVISSNDKNVDWIKISGNGKNALDFHIAYYLAKFDTDKEINHFILSKDTGFDPLIKHLTNKGISVKRIITIDEAVNKKSQKTKIDKNDYKKCLENILKISKAKRPKSVKTLTTHFLTIIGKNEENKVERVVEELFRNKIISTSDNNRLKYMK